MRLQSRSAELPEMLSGRPLLNENCTVTLTHSRNKDLKTEGTETANIWGSKLSSDKVISTAWNEYSNWVIARRQ